jgi:hypothetical protein
LDTETKGTGAHIAPLRRAREEQASERELALVLLKRPPRPLQSHEPVPPLRFKVVDVMSAQVLAQGIGARATVDLLEGMQRVTDARIFLWIETTGRWRLLTLAEQKALWRFRRRGLAAPSRGLAAPADEAQPGG